MKVDCPACSASGTIDESKVPKEGRKVTCPRCQQRFSVWPERSPLEIIQQRENMVCPNCKCEQSLAETCIACGVAVKKCLQTKVQQQEKERLEFVKLRSDTRQVDAWYSDLFDRRLSSLLVRVLSLLVLLGLFMTCSMNGARRSKLFAEKAADERKEREKQERSKSAETIDGYFKERFSTAVDLLAVNADACISQNYTYKNSWYNSGQPYYLTDDMSNNLTTINRRQREADAALSNLPHPSTKYDDCYRKVKNLSVLNKEVCRLANEYATHFSNLGDRLANFNFELNKLKGELNVCQDSFK